MDAESTATGAQGAVLSELGLTEGEYVQEFGFDEDVDHAMRERLEAGLGTQLQAEEEHEPVEAVILWWRHDDGDVTDLTDALVDAQRSLDEGPVWILTPRKGREGHVSPADLQEAAPVAGLHVTTGAGVSEHWAATRLVQKRGG